jgi:hypothetical protein
MLVEVVQVVEEVAAVAAAVVVAMAMTHHQCCEASLAQSPERTTQVPVAMEEEETHFPSILAYAIPPRARPPHQSTHACSNVMHSCAWAAHGTFVLMMKMLDTEMGHHHRRR